MERRQELNQKLRELCSNVYFQPPATITMRYPCIVYHLDAIDEIRADNKIYRQKDRYQLTYITKNPDDVLIRQIPFELPMCSFERFFVADNLNHYTYRLYF